MMSRCLLAVVVLSVVAVIGCGSMMLVQEGEPIWLMHRVSRDFPQPSHQVSLATYEVLKAELAKVEVDRDEMAQEDRFNTPDGKMPMPGEVKIPDEFPAFWIDGLSTRPLIVSLRFCDFTGKDRRGRQVDAVVRIGVTEPKVGTRLSIQVGDRGDEAASKALLDKIAERVAHPTYPPGSPQERDALKVLADSCSVLRLARRTHGDQSR